MKRLCIILPFLLFLYQSVTAQISDSEERKRRKEIAENILNTVINSTAFDSVYSQKKVYFLFNELLTEDFPLVLKRKNCKAKFIKEFEAKKVKQYAVLGDFTLDWNNIDSSLVRVQIEIMPEKALLNFSLKKEGDKWIIRNHIIFEN